MAKQLLGIATSTKSESLLAAIRDALDPAALGAEAEPGMWDTEPYAGAGASGK